ncbi:autoinducer binding domain-containing protein [Paracoccus sp. (in: a-proteobacteria)]|uniref:helix-turn-helix transcriptional regulator n=1 Tax=Paracoccus sp. TaxID=267 RepID=UPI00396CCABE
MSSQTLAQIDEDLGRLAPRGFMCGFHIRFSRPVRRVCTYPSSWIQAYTRMNLGIGDPMMIWCMLNEGSLRWSALADIIDDPLDVMGQARQHGLIYGVALSYGPVESRSYIGAANGDREFTDAEIAAMDRLLRQGHDMIERATSLRPILIEALEAIACGMTYDQACKALGISRTALRYRLQMARKALGAEDNAYAIRKAIDTGLLNGNSLGGIAKGLPKGPAG